MKIEDITNNLIEIVKNLEESNFIFKFIESTSSTSIAFLAP